MDNQEQKLAKQAHNLRNLCVDQLHMRGLSDPARFHIATAVGMVWMLPLEKAVYVLEAFALTLRESMLLDFGFMVKNNI